MPKDYAQLANNTSPFNIGGHKVAILDLNLTASVSPVTGAGDDALSREALVSALQKVSRPVTPSRPAVRKK